MTALGLQGSASHRQLGLLAAKPDAGCSVWPRANVPASWVTLEVSSAGRWGKIERFLAPGASHRETRSARRP